MTPGSSPAKGDAAGEGMLSRIRSVKSLPNHPCSHFTSGCHPKLDGFREQTHFLVRNEATFAVKMNPLGAGRAIRLARGAVDRLG
jgi:hypothetical protein